MNRKNVGHMLALLAIVAGLTLTAISASPTYAGTNGQQLQITKIVARGARVTVTGLNNNGQTATWQGWTPGTPSQIAPPSGETVSTTGWWWVGKVTIRVYWPTSTQLAYACFKEVPKTNWPNPLNHWTKAEVGFRYSTNTVCG